ncbi:MAG: nicotinamide-nucleotide amidohydrolase family protein [Spirochaetales bacterium]|nr:nicotinamide-nucleotide amidohydrolase family protein [Spirochaetales bacterium]
MNVELITVGNELLVGEVIDANSCWICAELTKLGFDVIANHIIRDYKKDIIYTLDAALSRANIVLITGNESSKIVLSQYFNSKLLGNIWFEKDDKVVISIPCVPTKMKSVMLNQVLFRLKNKFATSDILHKTVTVYGIPESELIEKIDFWVKKLPGYIDVTYISEPGKVRIKLTGHGLSLDQLNVKFDRIIDELNPIVGDFTTGIDHQHLNQLIGDLLIDKSMTIATAESCTGGNIAKVFTAVPGASAYFKGSVVAYDNSVKENVLGVSKLDLERYGAVSKPVVEQMALGVKNLLKTDWAIATSGIAGPTGGTEEKPVGTVWIAWAGPNGVESSKYQFGIDRKCNIKASTELGLFGIYKYLRI